MEGLQRVRTSGYRDAAGLTVCPRDQCSSEHRSFPLLDLPTVAPLAHPLSASVTGSTTADTMVAIVTQPLRYIVPLYFVFPLPLPSPFGSGTAISRSYVRKRPREGDRTDAKHSDMFPPSVHASNGARQQARPCAPARTCL